MPLTLLTCSLGTDTKPCQKSHSRDSGGGPGLCVVAGHFQEAVKDVIKNSFSSFTHNSIHSSGQVSFIQWTRQDCRTQPPLRMVRILLPVLPALSSNHQPKWKFNQHMSQLLLSFGKKLKDKLSSGLAVWMASLECVPLNASPSPPLTFKSSQSRDTTYP